MDELTGLLRAAAGGDGEALEAFVAATEPDLRRLCGYLVGGDEADDATQETYLAAWRALGSFRGESSARTWLFAIARRVALRHRDRGRRWRDNARSARPVAPTAGPGGVTEILELVATLEPDRRSAFVLTQLFGCSYAEAALIGECPIGTVRSRVARARRDLIEALEGPVASSDLA